MAPLTPGVIFLSRAFTSLLLPCLVTAAVRFILDNHFGILIPKRVVFGANVLAMPIVATIRLTWVQIKKQRRAATLGARLVPKVPGKWPANLDVLVQVINVRHGYLSERRLVSSLRQRFTTLTKPIADGHSEWIEHLGTTYDLHVFWEDIIFTYEPEHVKVCRKSSLRIHYNITANKKTILVTDFPNYIKGWLYC